MGDRDVVACGRKTVAAAGTPEALGSGMYQYVIIQAETNNTGGVCIGDSSVDETLATRNGYYLNPGESTPVLPGVLDEIYLDVNVSGDGVYYLAFSIG